MPQYLVFATDTYYPSGGAMDCFGIRETKEAAMTLGNAALIHTTGGGKDSAHIAIVAGRELVIIAVKHGATPGALRIDEGWTAPHPNMDKKPRWG